MTERVPFSEMLVKLTTSDVVITLITTMCVIACSWLKHEST